MTFKRVLSTALAMVLLVAQAARALDYSQYAQDANMKLGAASTTISVSGAVTDKEVWRSYVDSGTEDYFKTLQARLSFTRLITPPAGYPATAADDSSVGTVVWTNPDRAKTQDGSKASAALGSAAVSHYLKVTNFGFSVPATATVKGISVYVNCTADGSNVVDNSVKLVVNGVVSGEDKASGGSVTAGRTFGSATDTWGNSFTPAIVNASNFGAVFSLKNTHASVALNGYVDSIQITVYYEVPVSYKWQIRCKPEGAWTDLHTAVSENWGGVSAESAMFLSFEAVKPNANKVPFELRLLLTKASADTGTVTITSTANSVRVIGGL